MFPAETSQVIAAAWNRSYLVELADEIRELVFDDLFIVSIPAGSSIYEAFGPPRLALVLAGHAKVEVLSPGGRAATIRYAAIGQVIGLPSVISDGAPYGAKAITDCKVAMLNTAVLRRLASTDAAVAWLFARKIAEGSYESVELLGCNLFGDIRQRVSRHLLELAVRKGERLLVQANQQELADAIGSVREVVARALRQLQDEKYICRVPEGLILLNPTALRALASDC